MIWNRYGVTREVFLTKRYAIKVPKFTYGWKQFLNGLLSNMQEREFSKTGWPELCPVVLSLPGGWLVVMRRARPLEDIEWDTFDVERFQGWTVPKAPYVIPVESKRCSFGVLDERIVAVDYG